MIFYAILHQRVVRQNGMRIRLVRRQAIQQPGELPSLYGEHLLFALRPLESMLLKPLLPQTETIAVSVQNLYDILPPVAETEQIP